MGFYSENQIKEVQERADIVEIISEYIALQKRGDDFIGLCPFHSEKTPSFNVSPQKQLFYCFGCGTGGNVFTFLMKKDNLTFPEAVRYLADRYNVEISSGKLDREISPEFKEKQAQLKANRLATQFFKYNLFNTHQGQRALAYLKSRGIKPDTIEKFSLGYAMPAWDSLMKFAISRGIDIDILEKAGLIIQRNDKKGYYDRFRDRLMFPITDTFKNIIGFGGRVLNDGLPKYLNSPETKLFSKGKNLYGLSMIKKDRDLDIIVVEGYMDCIMLYQNGFTQTVASLGTALTQNQAKLIKRFSDRVILAYDSDSAGHAATLRGMNILADEGLKVNILNLPTGMDPDEFIRKEGKDAFKTLLSNAADLISYKLNLAKKGLDIKSPDDKIQFLKKAIEILSSIENQLELEVYLKELSSELKMPFHILKQEVQKRRFPNNGFKYKNSQTTHNNKEFRRLSPLTGFYKAERAIIKLLIENEQARQKIIKFISPDKFLNKNTRQIADNIYKLIQSEKQIEVSYLFNDLDEQASDELSQIMMELPEIQDEYMINSLIYKVMEGYLDTNINKVRKQMKKAEMLGQKEEIDNLLKAYQRLKTEMHQLKIQFTSEKGGA